MCPQNAASMPGMKVTFIRYSYWVLFLQDVDQKLKERMKNQKAQNKRRRAPKIDATETDAEDSTTDSTTDSPSEQSSGFFPFFLF